MWRVASSCLGALVINSVVNSDSCEAPHVEYLGKTYFVSKCDHRTMLMTHVVADSYIGGTFFVDEGSNGELDNIVHYADFGHMGLRRKNLENCVPTDDNDEIYKAVMKLFNHKYPSCV